MNKYSIDLVVTQGAEMHKRKTIEIEASSIDYAISKAEQQALNRADGIIAVKVLKAKKMKVEA